MNRFWLFATLLPVTMSPIAMPPAPELKPMPQQVQSVSTAIHKVHTKSLGKFKITAYCPCRECSGGYGKQTSTGKRARPRHTVAVDPRVIRYGTKLIIDGVTYTAEDCGGGVKGRHIDVYFNSHSEVERFGKRYREVRTYE